MNHILKKFDINTTNLTMIEPKELGLRKKVDIFMDNSHKTAYIHTAGKSRVLQKDVEVFENIILKLQEHFHTTVNKKHIFIDSPLCSKAKAKFENNNWKVYSI